MPPSSKTISQSILPRDVCSLITMPPPNPVRPSPRASFPRMCLFSYYNALPPTHPTQQDHLPEHPSPSPGCVCSLITIIPPPPPQARPPPRASFPKTCLFPCYNAPPPSKTTSVSILP
ncbi:hypothetical protein BsWGS_17752 [Bradybaena similaris]